MGVLAALLRERARVAGSGNPDGLLFDSCADRLDALESEVARIQEEKNALQLAMGAMAQEDIRREKALRADLEALLAALPVCTVRNCPDVQTRASLGGNVCDAHNPHGDCEDLPWAPLVRRLGEKK